MHVWWLWDFTFMVKVMTLSLLGWWETLEDFVGLPSHIHFSTMKT
jgi:hypothetical protein